MMTTQRRPRRSFRKGSLVITVERKHPTFFAEVKGVDISGPLAPDVFAEILTAFHENAVLVFRDQPLTHQQHIDFSANFGPLFEVTNYHRPEEERALPLKLTDISNIDHAGEIQSDDNHQRRFNLGNRIWHTDNTFKHVPARCSLLYATEVPSRGGETEFADMRAAYDSLPQGRKEEIEDLVVAHSIVFSRRRAGYDEYTDGAIDELKSVEQVLVRHHPAGRKALYLASHASHVIGWPEEKGRALLDELTEFAIQPQFTYAHTWRVHDLVIWDNRCTMHRSRLYPDTTERRVMQRTTVSDEMNSVERRATEVA